MKRSYYRRYGRRNYYGGYRRRRRRSTTRKVLRTARTGARMASRAGWGLFKFGTRAASYLAVTGVRTAAGIVRAAIRR